MPLVQGSCIVHTAPSGNSKTSGLFNVFMVLWVLSYTSKVPGAHQCTRHHNKNKPLQPEVWWKLQESSSSAAADPHICHSPELPHICRCFSHCKVGLHCDLAKLPQLAGCTLPKASSTHLCIWMLFWLNKDERTPHTAPTSSKSPLSSSLFPFLLYSLACPFDLIPFSLLCNVAISLANSGRYKD